MYNIGTKVTVLSGAQTYTANTYNMYYVVNDYNGTPMISAVVFEGAAPTDNITNDDIIFVVGGPTGTYSKLDSDGVNQIYNTYKAYKNGELIDNFYSKSTVIGSGFYGTNYSSTTEAYTLNGVEFVNNGTQKSGADALITAMNGTNVITTASGDFTINDSTVIVDTTGNDLNSYAAIYSAAKNGSGTGLNKEIAVTVLCNSTTNVASYVDVTAVGDYTFTPATTGAYTANYKLYAKKLAFDYSAGMTMDMQLVFDGGVANNTLADTLTNTTLVGTLPTITASTASRNTIQVTINSAANSGYSIAIT